MNGQNRTIGDALVTGNVRVSYSCVMTTKGQPGRVIRIDEDTWADYGKLCEEKGIARAADVRMYVKREVAAWRKANGSEPSKRKVVVRRKKSAEDSD